MAPNDREIHEEVVVELTRLQPIEAELVVAHLRSFGIKAIVGADSVYPSLTIHEAGVPVLVTMKDRAHALAVLEARDASD